jgi:hypothetical protein
VLDLNHIVLELSRIACDLFYVEELTFIFWDLHIDRTRLDC